MVSKKILMINCILAKDRYKIIKLLEKKPNLTSDEISKKVKMKKNFYYHRKKLEKYDLIESTVQGIKNSICNKCGTKLGRQFKVTHKITKKCKKIINQLDQIEVK